MLLLCMNNTKINKLVFNYSNFLIVNCFRCNYFNCFTFELCFLINWKNK